MKGLWAILLLAPAQLPAEKWVAFESKPFTVVTNGGDREAQEALVTLLQLQHTLSEKFGKELLPIWPLTVVQRKGNTAVVDVRLARDAYIVTVPVGELPRKTLLELGALLVRENTARMDPAIERGVVRVFSTLEVKGPRVTLGAPPPVAERDLEWARMQLLLTDPRFSGTARVLLANYAKAIEGDAAWRNTIGMLQRDFDKEAQKYLAAGTFGNIALNGKPVDPRRLRGRELEPTEAKLLAADIAGSIDAYKSVDLPAAKEGLGLLLVAQGKQAEAAPYLIGATGARALAALGTKYALEKAWRLNVRWSQPHELLAELETRSSDKAQRFKKAAELSPREVRLWRSAAEAFETAELLTEASRMWLAAERNSSNQQERDALRETRLAADRKRADLEEAERKRIAEEERLELERLKNEAVSRVREAEAKVNKGSTTNSTPVEWWDGPKPDASVRGQLVRVDCLAGGQLRLSIKVDARTTKALTIKDPSKIVLQGNTTATLGCGPQKPIRTVTAEYFKTGEVATLTFVAEP